MIGLISAGAGLGLVRPESFNDTVRISGPAIIAAGIITGLGTRMGGGCTSGHGVCGLSRLSLRSLTAVCTFMFTGAVTSYLTREGPLATMVMLPEAAPEVLNSADVIGSLLPTLVACGAAIVTFSYNNWLAKLLGRPPHKFEHKDEAHTSLVEHITSYAVGAVTGIALGISGMCNPDRVVNFLNFSSASTGWDPSLMAVMGGAVLFNLVSFRMMSKDKSPPKMKKTGSMTDLIKMGMHSANTNIDARLLVGSALFGIGWGLGGICPGPGLVALGACSSTARVFVPAVIGGVALHELAFKGGLHIEPAPSADEGKSADHKK